MDNLSTAVASLPRAGPDPPEEPRARPRRADRRSPPYGPVIWDFVHVSREGWRGFDVPPTAFQLPSLLINKRLGLLMALSRK